LTICADGWEGFLLNRCRAQLDALQDAWVEDVDTGIDTVTYELDWLFDEAVNPRSVIGLVDNHTVFRGLLNLCNYNCSLIPVVLVEGSEIRKGVFANDIRVEDEEGGIILS
tara:strand:- start:214 stop:546 length:333 start_codon:yes stop_codon:yes gene_type:complete